MAGRRGWKLAAATMTACAAVALTPAVASAYPSGYGHDGACTIRVRAFEHFTRARHEMQDQTLHCGSMKMEGLRRCWGKNYRNTWTTGGDYIDRQFAGCDAVYTKGWSGKAYAYSGA
jgi:hypothetical protein